MERFSCTVGDLAGYMSAVRDWPAGSLELVPGEDAAMAHLMLRRAAKLLNVPLETVWSTDGPAVLLWRRTEPRQ